MNDSEAMSIMAETRAAMGPDPFAILLKAPEALPSEWRGKSADEGFEYLRRRLAFTQDELARKSGVAQSIVSRVEGGADAYLSTWRRIYAAMGFDLMLLPISRLTVEELERRAEEGRPAGHWMRQRARPRRRRGQRRVSLALRDVLAASP